MSQVYHILNGDALKERLPTTIHGEVVTFRECLVDGPVRASTIQELLAIRASYLSTSADETHTYERYVVPEFEKLQAIEDGSTVHLWFEDDLFCQVNLWFVLHLLQKVKGNFHLVRPDSLSPYGFAYYNSDQLEGLFAQKNLIKQRANWSKLWDAYQMDEVAWLQQISQEMQVDYPYVAEAVAAHVDRFPNDLGYGRPERAILQIMEELETKAFGPIFREFTLREPIYGFGDIQVKRMFDELVDAN